MAQNKHTKRRVLEALTLAEAQHKEKTNTSHVRLNMHDCWSYRYKRSFKRPSIETVRKYLRLLLQEGLVRHEEWYVGHRDRWFISCSACGDAGELGPPGAAPGTLCPNCTDSAEKHVCRRCGKVGSKRWCDKCGVNENVHG